jgi:hypothetical protein
MSKLKLDCTLAPASIKGYMKGASEAN